jgi:hypothetical protein
MNKFKILKSVVKELIKFQIGKIKNNRMKKREKMLNNKVVVVGQLQQVLNQLSTEHNAIMENQSKIMSELKNIEDCILNITSHIPTKKLKVTLRGKHK